MSFDEEMMEIEEHFEKSLTALGNEFKRIRTGRANVNMVDHIQVEAYGSMMPINQVANISVPEAQQLLIKPYDASTIKDIERAIVGSDLGLAPQSDGEFIRLNIPPLSEERRKEMANTARDAAERIRIAMRNSRRDGIKSIESKGKEEKFPEDLTKKAVEEVTELLKNYESKVDATLKEKTEDLLKI